MTVHHVRFMDQVAPPWTLPAFNFPEQRKACEKCKNLIDSARQGMRCAAVLTHSGYRVGLPMYCVDVHTEGHCPL